jgi:C4-type Zn-finger protein
MKYAEKDSNMLNREHPISPTPSEIFRNILSDIIREGKFPQLFREMVQFYLKHIAVFKARVLDNNRITIPKEEVEILRIEPGDYVAVIITKIEGVKK